MKNSAPNSASAEMSAPAQAIDLDLSSIDPKAPDARAASDQADVAGSLSSIFPATEDLVHLLKTDCIRIGSMPNRSQGAYSSISFDELCASIISAKRNTQPIHVRALTEAERQANPDQRYELISGERRLRACIECELPVRAVITTVPQMKNFGMDALMENLHRENLSPFEFGQQIRHVLATDSTLSFRRLATKLGCNVSNVSRAIDIASLPSELIAAFASCTDIRYADAKPLSDAVATARDAAITEALRIGNDRQALKPAEIAALIATAAKRNATKGQNSVDAEKGISNDRSSSNRALFCAEREVGLLKQDKLGRVQVNLMLTLTSEQQGALAKQIESFIQRRVLRISTGKASPAQPQRADLVESAAVLTEVPPLPKEKQRGVA